VKFSVRAVAVHLAVLFVLAASVWCQDEPISIQDRLAEWRQGVWITGTGTYTIWTDSHYFVVSYEGDSASPNIYVGASQVRFHEKGIARKQTLRHRQMPSGDKETYRKTAFQPDHTEAPMLFDSNIIDGVIYDAVIEATDEYILLATCNGDKEKIFSNGVSVYLPAGGGEYYSYRVEKLSDAVE
jgi:hypothetical protein